MFECRRAGFVIQRDHVPTMDGLTLEHQLLDDQLVFRLQAILNSHRRAVLAGLRDIVIGVLDLRDPDARALAAAAVPPQPIDNLAAGTLDGALPGDVFWDRRQLIEALDGICPAPPPLLSSPAPAGSIAVLMIGYGLADALYIRADGPRAN